MTNRGYDVVVDVDAEGDLGHTDLQEDLEFHSSNFSDSSNARSKIPPSNLPFVNDPSTSQNSQTSKRYLWSLSFYAQYFAITDSDLLHRCISTLYPRTPFLDILDGNPDLYGPFWIATTVVFILFITGTISRYLAVEHKDHFPYDFRLLSGAAGLVYGYTAFVPVGLWGVMKWFRQEGAGIVECWALYGYANLIWIPVACISWSPITVLNYVFVAVGFVLSAGFLVRNLWPVLGGAEGGWKRGLVIAVVVLHAALAIAIKQLFFAHGSLVGKREGGEEMEKVVRSLLGI